MRREAYYTRIQIVILLALGVYFGIINKLSEIFSKLGMEANLYEWPIIIALVIVIPALFVCSLKKSKLRDKNKEDYDKEIVLKAIHQVLPNAKCRVKGYINPSALYSIGIVPDFSDVVGSYLVEYNKSGCRYSFSNLELSYHKSDDTGNSNMRTIFWGQAFSVKYKENINGCVCIRTRVKEDYFHYKKMGKNNERIYVENTKFNNLFEVYATDSQAAFYVLSPYVQEQLLILRQKFKIFGIAITGNLVFAAIETNKILFAKPFRAYDIENMSVENTKQELQKVLSFMQRLEDMINGKVKNEIQCI